jgi:nucleoside-diphosphate-sugar epimerase
MSNDNTALPSFTDKLALGEAKRGDRTRRVVVTGGSGKLGRATVKYLSDEGWEVISVDTRRPPTASEDGKSGLGGAYRLVEIDLEDMGAVLETFMTIDMAYSGVDAVVHLAAIPSPGQTNSSRQFRTNTMSTYNVLEACRKLRITNVVLASSETLIGIPFDPHPPASLPITEEHERRPESAYSLSKLVGETLADQFCRWDPQAKIISLRFSNVMLPAEYANFEGWQEDPMARYWNCWGYIDARDGGQSVSKALESRLKGHHQYLIAAEDTCMRKGNKELVEAAFPGVKYEPTKGENDSLLSIEKAKKELGFAPKFKWQDQL